MESQRRFSTQLKAITMAPIIKSSITSCTERIAVCFQQGVYTVTICMWQLHGTHTVVSYLSRVHYSIKNWYKLCRSLTVGSVRGHTSFILFHGYVLYVRTTPKIHLFHLCICRACWQVFVIFYPNELYSKLI